MSLVRRHTILLGLTPALGLVVLFWGQPRPPTAPAIDTLEDVLLASLGIVTAVGVAGSLQAKILTPPSRCARLVGAAAAVSLSGMLLLAGISTPAPALGDAARRGQGRRGRWGVLAGPSGPCPVMFWPDEERSCTSSAGHGTTGHPSLARDLVHPGDAERLNLSEFRPGDKARPRRRGRRRSG